MNEATAAITRVNLAVLSGLGPLIASPLIGLALKSEKHSS
jgi:hypothetical protein